MCLVGVGERHAVKRMLMAWRSRGIQAAFDSLLARRVAQQRAFAVLFAAMLEKGGLRRQSAQALLASVYGR